jgi:predicted pyridoxine 5'-phosphate oxidase superfamily flavin-nucleotide-binding protein
MLSNYHAGEIAVQRRAGVEELAQRTGRGIRSTIPPVAQEFLRSQPMVIVGTVDGDRRVWASLLTGEPGFMQAVDEQTLRIDSRIVPGDPLHANLKKGAPVGLLAIEPARRRRMRLNGEVQMLKEGALYVRARQVYANCPKYIQAREWQADAITPLQATEVWRGTQLTAEQQDRIKSADTFFIASAHQQAGADASHRGGPPGFVRVAGSNKLMWGDYPGNGMFQTLGNIAVNPSAGLLFIDWERGSTLQLTGRARIVWDRELFAGFAGAERAVEFAVDEVIEIRGATRLRWRFLEYSPFNPPR